MQNKLFNLRKMAGLSLRTVAKSVGISHTTIMRAETGTCDVGHKKIATLLNFYQEVLKERDDCVSYHY